MSASPTSDESAAGRAAAPAPEGAGESAETAARTRAFRSLEGLSITHSLIYLGLIAMWITDGPPDVRNALGWAHGILWIVMSLLIIAAARKAIVSFRLAVLVAVVGGLGPFAGTLGFLWEGRGREQADGRSRPDHDAPGHGR